MNASSRRCRVPFERAHVINAEPLHLQVRVLVKVVRVVPPDVEVATDFAGGFRAGPGQPLDGFGP